MASDFMAMIRGALALSVAAALLLIFPVVAPCMAFLRRVRSIQRRPRKIEGNVVIVTGASSGIGTYIALEFAKYGARLVLVARREDRLREVSSACLEIGALDAAVCRADITKEEDCRRVVDYTVSRFGRVDVLVNNAGIAHSGLFEKYEDTSSFQSTIELDFFGTVLTTYYALEHLRRARGHIVATASVSAYVPFPRQSLYNASKAAIVQFFDTLRTEPIGSMIDITIAMPGFVVSEMTGDSRSHIPWWWPMLQTDSAAKSIVEATIARKRYAIIPSWYSTWIPYRVFAMELMEWIPRTFVVGKPTSQAIQSLCYAFLGEQFTEKLFIGLGFLATGIFEPVRLY